MQLNKSSCHALPRGIPAGQSWVGSRGQIWGSFPLQGVPLWQAVNQNPLQHLPAVGDSSVLYTKPCCPLPSTCSEIKPVWSARGGSAAAPSTEVKAGPGTEGRNTLILHSNPQPSPLQSAVVSSYESPFPFIENTTTHISHQQNYCSYCNYY